MQTMAMVDPAVSLQSAGLEDGDNLTAIVIHPKVAATSTRFCIVLQRRQPGCDLGPSMVMAVTALKSKINSRVSSRFKQLTAHLLRS